MIEMTDRKFEIRTLPEPMPAVKQRIAEAAASLNRAGDAAAHVEIISEALTKFAHLLYTRDTDGQPANIDARTGKVLLPAPWGSLGWKRWGLRKWEAEIMRAIMLARVVDTKRPPLFDYGYSVRKWFLNVADYPNIDAAAHYLNRAAITLAEWRKCTNACIERRQQLSAK